MSPVFNKFCTIMVDLGKSFTKTSCSRIII